MASFEGYGGFRVVGIGRDSIVRGFKRTLAVIVASQIRSFDVVKFVTLAPTPLSNTINVERSVFAGVRTLKTKERKTLARNIGVTFVTELSLNTHTLIPPKRTATAKLRARMPLNSFLKRGTLASFTP